MCIINLHLQDHPTYKLIIAANRDEFLQRPTAPASFWEDAPHLLAGRDLEAMGTWLGITKQGRFAALTNYRNPKLESPNKKSRGDIVEQFLNRNDDPTEYLQQLRNNREQYNGFNVIVGTVDELFYYGNEQKEIIPLQHGTHGLSNHLLNTPWPKVQKAKKLLHDYVTTVEKVEIEQLFHILANDTLAKKHELPQTGVPHEIEKKLSSIFIEMDDYGTRASTVILVTHHNEVTFVERTFERGSKPVDRSFQFNIKNSPL